MKKLLVTVMFAGALVFMATPAVQGGSIVWHDPYLNWDLVNWTGNNLVDDLAIIVDNPNGNFNPNPANPGQLWSVPFTRVRIDPVCGANPAGGPKDYDGDGDLDTMVKYDQPAGGIPIMHGQMAHGGIYMLGSGAVIDAYWTVQCNQVGSSIPVTYEQTEIRADPEVHMHLQINKGYREEFPSLEIGWTEIRTFVNLPADLLDLPNINKDLDLSTLAAYEVTPEIGQPGLPGTTGTPILLGDTILQPIPPDSFFDVYLDVIPPENATPEFESLLVATVVGQNPANPNENIIFGQFWNLNPQSPEPGTLMLLAAGAGFLLRRRRRRNT